MDATGKGVTELNINRASTGGLSGQDIGKVAGEFASRYACTSNTKRATVDLLLS